MKKVILLLMILYVTSVSGVTLNRHYCGGELASVSLPLFEEDHDCDCGSKEMKKDCCQDNHVVVKVNLEHKSSAKPVFSIPVVSILPVIQDYTISANSLNKIFYQIYSYQPPPPEPNNFLLVLNSIFRI